MRVWRVICAPFSSIFLLECCDRGASCAPARLVFDCLFFQMIESLVDGRLHVAGLGQSDQRSVARADGDFCFVAVLLHGQDYFGFKFVAKDFTDFQQAGFDFLADGGSNFVVSAGVFDVHERPFLSSSRVALGHSIVSRSASAKRFAYASCSLFLYSALVGARDAHVFPVFRDRAAGDLDTLRLQDAGDLLVGQWPGGIFFFDQLFDPALEDQQRSIAALRVRSRFR